VFSPDGTRLAVAMEDGTLRLVDVASGNELRQWQMPTRTMRVNEDAFQSIAIRCLHFSEDGSKVYATTSQKIHRWDTATGKELAPIARLRGPDDHGLHCFPSRNNNLLLISDTVLFDTRLFFYEEDTGRVLRTVDLKNKEPECVAFTPDNR